MTHSSVQDPGSKILLEFQGPNLDPMMGPSVWEKLTNTVQRLQFYIVSKTQEEERVGYDVSEVLRRLLHILLHVPINVFCDITRIGKRLESVRD